MTRDRPAAFAFNGLVGGVMVGSGSVGAEWLFHGRDLREVALLTYAIVYPLLGLGFGCLICRFPHARRWVRPPDFFSDAPLPPEEAASRGRLTRRFVAIGFGAGIAIALLATALDFGWRGWPFLAETLICGLLLYPYLGVLLGFNLSLRPGASKPSIRRIRFRMGTLMILVAYFAILLGLGTEASRYSSVARQYHAKVLNVRTMVGVFLGQIDKNRADQKRADHAKQLRAGRIPDGLLPSQKASLKGLEGKATEDYKRYRYGLIADGEDSQAKLASQNLAEYSKLVAYHKQLAEKYTKAAQKPWLPVAPDPPLPK